MTGCSAGAALGLVGVMALADPPAPSVAATAPAPPAETLPPTTLPPKHVIHYVYRTVVVPDGAAAPPATPVVSRTSTAAPAPVPAPSRPRAAAPVTTTTAAS